MKYEDIPLTSIMRRAGIKKGHIERYRIERQPKTETIEIVMDRKRRWAKDLDCRGDGVDWFKSLLRGTYDLIFIGLIERKLTADDLDRPLIEVFRAVKPPDISIKEIKAKGLI